MQVSLSPALQLQLERQISLVSSNYYQRILNGVVLKRCEWRICDGHRYGTSMNVYCYVLASPASQPFTLGTGWQDYVLLAGE